MAKESTHQVMKEMMFDDDYDLNGFNNQDLEGDSSCNNLWWEYEPLKEVEPRYEVKESLKLFLVKPWWNWTLTYSPLTHIYWIKKFPSKNHEFYEDEISSIVLDSQV